MTPRQTSPFNSFIIGLLLLGVSLIFLETWPGCSDVKNTPTEVPKSIAKPTYRIGLIPEQNVFTQKERYSLLLNELGNRLDVRLDSRILPSYGSVIKEFRENRIDGAFLGSYISVIVMKTLPVQIIACPMSLDGETTYRGLIITKKGSGVTKDVATWKGKSAALVHPYTSAGYLFPLFLLKKAGYHDYQSFFGKVTMLGSHDAVYYAVLNGSSDLGALKNTIFKRLASVAGQNADDLIIVGESKDFPDNSLIMRSDLDRKFLENLKETLVHLHESSEGSRVLQAMGFQSFIPRSLDDYVNVSELIETAP